MSKEVLVFLQICEHNFPKFHSRKRRFQMCTVNSAPSLQPLFQFLPAPFFISWEMQDKTQIFKRGSGSSVVVVIWQSSFA